MKGWCGMGIWKRKNGNSKQNSQKQKIKCSVHGGVIKGKVHYWHHEPMCLTCYRRFTIGDPTKGKGPIHIVKRPPVSRPVRKKKGFFAKLFNW